MQVDGSYSVWVLSSGTWGHVDWAGIRNLVVHSGFYPRFELMYLLIDDLWRGQVFVLSHEPSNFIKNVLTLTFLLPCKSLLT